MVSVGGEVDMATAPQFGDVLQQAATADPGKLVVDLLETEFMDSSGLAVLLAIADQAGPGTEIVLVCPLDGPVHRLLVLTGTDSQFGIFESLARAVHS